MDTSLFTAEGQPVAYICGDLDNTLFLWDGTPVAYLYEEHIYGINGSHLGWFDGALVWDHQGRAVGYTRQRLRVLAALEPLKGLRRLIPLKQLREPSPLRPVLSFQNRSSLELEQFLADGI